jgi:hypothetical protein
LFVFGLHEQQTYNIFTSPYRLAAIFAGAVVVVVVWFLDL